MSENSTLHDILQTTKCERYLIGVLCFVNIVNYMDRGGLSAVLVTIQNHFSIGDDLGGLLQTGLMLALTISAPAFGYCGDRYSRKYILIACVCFWAISTVVGAFSENYWVLLLSRLMVGLGQSGYTAVTPTIISDLANGGARTVFLCCFFLAIPIGASCGVLTVANVAMLTGNWSFGLCVGPCLCVVGVLLLAFARFPKRGVKEAAGNEVMPLKSPSFKSDLKYLMKIPSFCLISLAFNQVAFFVGALVWWLPKCLYHGFHLLPDKTTVEIKRVAFSFGIITLTAGILSNLTALLFSRLLRPRFPKADALICAFGFLFGLPFVLLALTMIAMSKIVALTTLFFSEYCMYLNWTLQVDILLYVVMPSRRTSAQGLYMLVGHLFGDCISPYIVGMLSEHLKRNYEFTNGSFFLPIVHKKASNPNSHAQSFHSLQMSLFLISVVLIVGCICFFAVSHFVQKDKENAAKMHNAGGEEK